nr:MAG TPA: hypothetical protein [Caudoviricetes sp.]
MTRGGQRINAGRPRAIDKKEFTVRLTVSEKDFIEFSRKKLIDLKALQKTLLTLFALLCFAMPVNAMILQGSVEYTVEKARKIAFDNAALKISTQEFYNDKKDPNYFINTLSCIRSGITHDDFYRPRKIIPFYEDKKLAFYGVQYDDSPAKKYYYSPTGKLLKYEINNFKGSYPYKTMAYDIKGKLININLVVSSTESYLYSANKEFIGHWINNQFYNADGSKDITRHL